MLITYLITGYALSTALLFFGGCRSNAPPPCLAGNLETSSVHIPGGEYVVGCRDRDTCGDNKQHGVSTNGFHIDRHQVTYQAYSECVNKRVCSRFYGDLASRDQVAFVSYDDALKYCGWKGGRLPLPSEWEIAGRGHTNHIYPWGNVWNPDNLPLRQHANLSPDRFIVYTRVCSRPQASSIFGVHDLSGTPEFVMSDPVQVRGAPPDSIERTPDPDPRDVTLFRIHPIGPAGHAAFRCVYDRP
jgi:formylglycine-generating enzyme required for sulfatase activity